MRAGHDHDRDHLPAYLMQAVTIQTVRRMYMLPLFSQTIHLKDRPDALPAQIHSSPICLLGSTWVGHPGLIPVLQNAQ